MKNDIYNWINSVLIFFWYKLLWTKVGLWTTSEPTKMNTFIENKVLQKLKFSKNVNDEKLCSWKHIFQLKKYLKIDVIKKGQ